MQNIFRLGNLLISALRLLSLPKKMRRIMKITTLFLFMACMHVSAKSSAQGITLVLRNAPLETVFNAIQKQTEYSFVYNNSLLKKAKKVDINARQESIDEVLEQCFNGQPFSYNIVGMTIVVVPKEEDRFKAINVETLAPPPIEIHGRVVDQEGKPLQNVSILVKGTKTGTTTDHNGNYRLSNLQDNVVLVFSYIGYESQEIGVKGRVEISVKLSPKEKLLEETVIDGYITRKKNSFTGNSIEVKGKELLKVGPRNMIELLQVFDPSFRITQNIQMGSNPNVLPEFYLRGQSSLGITELDKEDLSKANLATNPNLPIFIMDGHEVSVERVYDFDINRIESVTILKDAAATAIYGSRASNGVVVIEIKRPVSGKLTVDYNMTLSVTAPDLSDYNLMGAKDKLQAEVAAGAFIDEYNLPQFTMEKYKEYYGKLNNVMKGVNTYWLSKPLQTGIDHKHSVYIEGGEKNIKFGVELRYDNQNGVMKGSVRNRTGAGVMLDYKVKNIQLTNHTTYDHVTAKNSEYGSFSNFSHKLPYDEIYDPITKRLNPVLKSWHSSNNNQMLVNPLYEGTLENFDINSYDEIVNDFSMDWYILPSLQFKGQLSLSKNDSKAETFTDPGSGQYYGSSTPVELRGALSNNFDNSFGWNTNLLLIYNNQIKRSALTGTLGFNALEQKSIVEQYSYRGFPSGALHSINYAQEVVGKPSASDAKSRLFGVFGTANYSFDNIYLADVSLRMDGSSQFGSDKKSAPFWSAGIGVNMHKYSFLKKYRFINRLKLRGSVGQTGKITFPAYAARDMYSISLEQYSTGYGASLMAMGNTNLKWEKKNSVDLGFDAVFFDNSLSIVGTYYAERTQDLITSMTIPSSSGFRTFLDNIGEVENTGFEIYMRWVAYKSKNFNLSFYGNAAHNRNRITHISKAMDDYNKRIDAFFNDYDKGSDADRAKMGFAKSYAKYVEGGSLTSIFGMKSLGINPADGKEVYLDHEGNPTYEWNSSDQVIIGNTEPKLNGAFGFYLQWKKLSVNTSFLYEFGADRYNNTLVEYVENANVIDYNADLRVLTDRWQKIGDVTPLKDIADRNLVTRPTSRFVQRYNALKVLGLTLGYDLPKTLTNKLGLSMARLQLNTSDLATFSTILQERGLDYPFARTYNFSLNLTF
ncbi:MAG: SusC/RagA family TonB-linked outer membrane protein [Ginsengibacter sp.]